MKAIKRTGFTLLGILALFSLICTMASRTILNADTMNSAFETLTAEDRQNIYAFGMTYTDLPLYARAITDYLSGKGDICQVTRDGETVPAFEDADGQGGESKQNVHLRDVRGIIRFMVSMRWFGLGGTLAVLSAVYLLCYVKKRAFPYKDLLWGFSIACLILFGLSLVTVIWLLIDFYGFFYGMHLILFPRNNYWLLDPSRHLLMALMPLSFFQYYAQRLLIALLPVIGIMIVLPIANFKIKEGKEP